MVSGEQMSEKGGRKGGKFGIDRRWYKICTRGGKRSISLHSHLVEAADWVPAQSFFSKFSFLPTMSLLPLLLRPPPLPPTQLLTLNQLSPGNVFTFDGIGVPGGGWTGVGELDELGECGGIDGCPPASPPPHHIPIMPSTPASHKHTRDNTTEGYAPRPLRTCNGCRDGAGEEAIQTIERFTTDQMGILGVAAWSAEPGWAAGSDKTIPPAAAVLPSVLHAFIGSLSHTHHTAINNEKKNKYWSIESLKSACKILS